MAALVIYGDYGIVTKNGKGLKLFEFYDTDDLIICSTNFRKPACYLQIS